MAQFSGGDTPCFILFFEPNIAPLPVPIFLVELIPMRIKKPLFVQGKKLASCVFFPIFLALTGCSTFPSWMASSGPGLSQVLEQEQVVSPIPILEVTDTVARQILGADRADSFAATFSAKTPSGYVVGAGDVLDVSIWEAPPAVLIGAAAGPGLTSARQTTLPEQIVNVDGFITIASASFTQTAALIEAGSLDVVL